MRRALLACLVALSAVPAFAQTAEELYNRASVNSLKAYGEGGAAAGDAAVADLDAAIKLHASYHDAYNLRANMKLHKGDLDGALADYSKAISLAASVTAAYHTNRAQLLRKRNDLKGALSDMDQALTLRPKDERAHMDRGEIKMSAKDHAGALKDFNRSLELKPDFLPARRRRAEAYRALGQAALAAEDEKVYKKESEKFLERFK